MSNAVVGYARVSSADQNPDRQTEQLKQAGASKLFIDKVTGAARQRPGLDDLRDYVREGDEIVVSSIDRLARNVEDLLGMVREWREQGITVRFLKEQITVGATDNPMSSLIIGMLGHIAEFERAVIRERQREGIAEAKKRGAYKGRKKALSRDEVAQLREDAKTETNRAALARKYGIGRTTLYRYLQGAQ